MSGGMRSMKRTLSLLAAALLLAASFTGCRKTGIKTGDGASSGTSDPSAAVGDGPGASETAAGETLSGQTAQPGQTTLPGQTAAPGQTAPAATSAPSGAAPSTAAPASAAQPTGADPAATAAPVSGNAPAVSAAPAVVCYADKTAGLKAGDTVTVTVRLDHGERLCSVTALLEYDPAVFSVVRVRENRIAEFDSVHKESSGVIEYAGITMRTVNVASDTLFTAELQVSAVPAAKSASVGVRVSQWLRGLDDNGDQTETITASVPASTLTLAFA